MNEPLQLIILISGNGSNLQAIIDAIAQDQLPARICLVISNRADAFGLTRARQAGIPTEILLHADYSQREAYDRALRETIDRYLDPTQKSLIVLAGFMRILSPEFVAHYCGRIINIHPSLLPKYPGLHTHERVLEAGDREHGTTVHLVTEDLDAGPILGQRKLDVRPDDTPETLQARVHALEHELYPEVIRHFCKDLPSDL